MSLLHAHAQCFDVSTMIQWKVNLKQSLHVQSLTKASIKAYYYNIIARIPIHAIKTRNGTCHILLVHAALNFSRLMCTDKGISIIHYINTSTYTIIITIIIIAILCTWCTLWELFLDSIIFYIWSMDKSNIPNCTMCNNHHEQTSNFKGS